MYIITFLLLALSSSVVRGPGGGARGSGKFNIKISTINYERK